MHPESTNGTSGSARAIPMAWLCAEYIADEILRGGALVEAGSLEYRAGRETLALTVHLCDTTDDVVSARAMCRMEEWLRLTSYGHPWYEWVVERLAARTECERSLGRPDPDLALARDAWRWLGRTELLATDLADIEPWHLADPAEPYVDEREQVWTPAWQLGLPLSHLAVHLF
ncbi:hypothetical protein [Streptomyces sp. NPDC020965]|uniref:hypothetical protein n=1 Tax=Streptomyces sp. NPDC020965 TaxID=3365105 RepID=UPI0037AC8B9E